MTSSSVLFICTGNYYRSRFAEEFFRHRARELRLPWITDSRGLRIGHPGNVGPISRHARLGLQSLGIAFDEDRYPRPLLESDLERATRTIAVDRSEHEPMIAQSFPTWLSRIEFWDVEDIDRARPDDALARLGGSIEGLLAQLIGVTEPRPRA